MYYMVDDGKVNSFVLFFLVFFLNKYFIVVYYKC